MCIRDSRMCLVNNAVYIAKYATAEKCQNAYGYIPGDIRKHPGAVSYTHLDVYKRQALSCSGTRAALAVERAAVPVSPIRSITTTDGMTGENTDGPGRRSPTTMTILYLSLIHI